MYKKQRYIRVLRISRFCSQSLHNYLCISFMVHRVYYALFTANTDKQKRRSIENDRIYIPNWWYSA